MRFSAVTGETVTSHFQARLASLGFALAITIALLALSGCGAAETESQSQPVETSSPPASVRFALRDVTVESGIHVNCQLSTSHNYHMPDIMGYGCAALDFDLDGDVDLLFACHEQQTSNRTDTTESQSSETQRTTNPETSESLVWPGTFFRQAEPGRFEKMSTPTNENNNATAMGIATGDVNNDGWPDVLITYYGNDRLFLNRSGKGFEDVSEAAGILNPRWGTSACFVDYDRDGWLDLYVTNYVDYFPQNCVQLSGVNPDFCGPQRFQPSRDCLFRNTTGESPSRIVQFEDVTTQTGIGELGGKGLGVAAADFTGDGWQDIYVANDQEPNFLWVNQRDGTFNEEAILLGCATDHLGNSQASMGVCVHDFDDNGYLDILVTHIDGERNTLYLGTPNGDFRDATLTSPACRQSLGQTGFGVATTDLDGNGTFEILVANGRVRRPDGIVEDRHSFWAPYRQSAMIHSPDGASSIREQSSLYRGLIVTKHANDDGQCLVLTSVDRPPVLIQNSKLPGIAPGLNVRAIDSRYGQRDALGATVTLKTNTRLTIRLIQTCGSYLSATMPNAEFTLKPHEQAEELIVTWPDGQRETFPAPTGSHHVALERGFGSPTQ